jgi:hypothetical protein
METPLWGLAADILLKEVFDNEVKGMHDAVALFGCMSLSPGLRVLKNGFWHMRKSSMTNVLVSLDIVFCLQVTEGRRHTIRMISLPRQRHQGPRLIAIHS